MTDRGTLTAVQTADQYQQDGYEHLVWPGHPSDFGDQFFVQDAPTETFGEDDANYHHTPFHPGIDFGPDYTRPLGGDGWYLTEAVTTDKKLQGAPNGRSSVSGEISMQLGLGPAASGGSSVLSAPALLKTVGLGAGAAGKSSIAATLTNTKNLSGASAGSSVINPKIALTVPGKYRNAVLADSPTIYLDYSHFTEPSSLYNDPSLGGQQYGTMYGTQYGYKFGPSLIETEISPSVPPNGNPSWSSSFGLFTTVPPSHTVEFWYQKTTDLAYTQNAETLFYGYANTPAGYTYYWLRIYLDPDSRVRVERAYSASDPGRVSMKSQKKIRDGVPHQLAVTWNGETSTCTLYIDGQFEVSQVTTAGVPSPLTTSNISQNLNADALDDLSIYPTALAPGRIQAHYLAAWTNEAPARTAGSSETTATLGLAFSFQVPAVSTATRSYVPPARLQALRVADLGSGQAVGQAQAGASGLNVANTGPVVDMGTARADGASVVAGDLNTYLFSGVALSGAAATQSQVAADLEVQALFDIITDGLPLEARRVFT